MAEKTHRTPEINILSVIFYILAGLCAAGAVIILVWVFSVPGALNNIEGTLSMLGLGAFAGMILNPLKGGLINLGILLAVLVAALAGTLFGLGRLAARQTGLLARVARLEEEMQALGQKNQS